MEENSMSRQARIIITLPMQLSNFKLKGYNNNFNKCAICFCLRIYNLVVWVLTLIWFKRNLDWNNESRNLNWVFDYANWTATHFNLRIFFMSFHKILAIKFNLNIFCHNVLPVIAILYVWFECWHAIMNFDWTIYFSKCLSRYFQCIYNIITTVFVYKMDHWVILDKFFCPAIARIRKAKFLTFLQTIFTIPHSEIQEILLFCTLKHANIEKKKFETN